MGFAEEVASTLGGGTTVVADASFTGVVVFKVGASIGAAIGAEGAEGAKGAETVVAAAAMGSVSSPPFISTMGMEFAVGGKEITDASGLYPVGAPPPRIAMILPPALGSMDAFGL